MDLQKSRTTKVLLSENNKAVYLKFTDFREYDKAIALKTAASLMRGKMLRPTELSRAQK